MKRWIAALPLLALAALAVMFAAYSLHRNPQVDPKALVGKPAPAIALPGLEDGRPVAIAQATGGKVALVNFFASWCLQCRAEHEDLVSTSDAFSGSGVRFVEITYQDSVPEAVAFLDEFGRSDATIYARDPRSRAAIAFGVFGIPETFFIDEDGVVVGKIIGESNALVLGNAIDAIRRGERPGQQVVGETETAP